MSASISPCPLVMNAIKASCGTQFAHGVVNAWCIRLKGHNGPHQGPCKGDQVMSAHTPGPWQVGDGHALNLEGHVFAGRRLVANCHAHSDGREGTRQENNANARLIAAAPRMLAFIQIIAAGSANSHDANEARALLRDVEGESNG